MQTDKVFERLKNHIGRFRSAEKFTKEQVVGVYKGAIEGKSYKVIGRETGVPYKRVGAIVLGQTYRQYAGELARLLDEHEAANG